VVEELGGEEADAAGVGGDGGERRLGEGAADGVVIDAEDGDLVGDVEVGGAAGVEELLAEEVVAGEDADGFGEAFEPGNEGGAIGGPAAGVGEAEGADAGVEMEVGSAGELVEGFVLPADPGVVGDAAEAEVAEAAVAEVVEGECGFGADVGVDGGVGGEEVGGAEVDDGAAEGAGGAGGGGGFGTDEEAVGFPGAEVGGGGVGAGGFGEEDRPVGVGLEVVGDAGEEAAGVGVAGFDEEGDTEWGGGDGAGRRHGDRIFA
jgi:hypothetical protein